jgi:fatty acid desaturase
MSQTCPLAFRLIDCTLARISAIFVSLFVLLFLFTNQNLFLFFILVDFFMRLYGFKKYSLVLNTAILTKKILSLKTEMTDAGAKRLAAHFGILFVVLLILESFFSLHVTLYITAAFFLLCTGLEIFFGYCIGCKIYFLIKKIYPSFME